MFAVTPPCSQKPLSTQWVPLKSEIPAEKEIREILQQIYTVHSFPQKEQQIPWNPTEKQHFSAAITVCLNFSQGLKQSQADCDMEEKGINGHTLSV